MKNWSFTTEQIHAELDLLSLEYDTINIRVCHQPCELICANVENEYGPRLTAFFVVDDEADGISLLFRYGADCLPIYDREYIREADAVVSLDYPALRITLQANGDVHIKSKSAIFSDVPGANISACAVDFLKLVRRQLYLAYMRTYLNNRLKEIEEEVTAETAKKTKEAEDKARDEKFVSALSDLLNKLENDDPDKDN